LEYWLQNWRSSIRRRSIHDEDPIEGIEKADAEIYFPIFAEAWSRMSEYYVITN
jgi:hypothetical protein